MTHNEVVAALRYQDILESNRETHHATYTRRHTDDAYNVDRLKDQAAEEGDGLTHVDILRREREAEALLGTLEVTWPSSD